MRIKINTQVEADLPAVKKGFTSTLFLELNPPFPPVVLKEFGGCETGDRVVLELNFLLFKQQWISDIIDDGENKLKWFFVDKGVKLPFFLKKVGTPTYRPTKIIRIGDHRRHTLYHGNKTY